MSVRIGDLLVRRGILTQDQAEHVAQMQSHSRRPFGDIAEELFGIEAAEVEQAWSEQYASITKWIDPMTEPVDVGVLSLLTRRQAWQFCMLPIGYDGPELLVCTTTSQLTRALNFATAEIPAPTFFVLSTPERLSEALMQHYPMDGMSALVLEDGGLRLAG